MKTIHAVILGAALLAACIVCGTFFYASKQTKDIISVVGAATVPFESDIVKWSISFSRTIPPDSLKSGYRIMSEDLEYFKRRLLEKRLDLSQLSVRPISSYEIRDNKRNLIGYNMSQGFFVVSENINKVEELALDPGSLASQGVVIDNSDLEYFYSELADLKHQLMAEAAADARIRAENIATSGGVTLGRPITMRSGVFQITEPYSTEVSDYGVYNTRTRQKEITVTVRGTFLID